MPAHRETCLVIYQSIFNFEWHPEVAEQVSPLPCTSKAGGVCVCVVLACFPAGFLQAPWLLPMVHRHAVRLNIAFESPAVYDYDQVAPWWPGILSTVCPCPVLSGMDS